MKSIADSAGAAPTEAFDMMAAERETGLGAREINATGNEGLRCQLGETVFADVYTFNAALKFPHRESQAQFFKLIAFGPSWAGAVANWKRNQQD